MLEARVARLESDVGHIKSTLDEMKADVKDLGKELRADVKSLDRDLKTDFRILFGALITVALGLAGLMAKGFGWL